MKFFRLCCFQLTNATLVNHQPIKITPKSKNKKRGATYVTPLCPVLVRSLLRKAAITSSLRQCPSKLVTALSSSLFYLLESETLYISIFYKSMVQIWNKYLISK